MHRRLRKVEAQPAGKADVTNKKDRFSIDEESELGIKQDRFSID
jgi:hypothetical protein